MDTGVQPRLFVDRIEEAIDEVIKACGGRKKFATEMWPSKSARDAHNLLDACLNPERREKFSPQDMIYVLRRGRDAECHAAMHFLCDEVGYTRARPLNPEDERQQLQRKVIEAAQSFRQDVDRLERLSHPPALRGLDGGKP